MLSVKLKHIDDRMPYGYPTRSIEIRTDSGTITTPTRMVTNHEYNQKVQTPSDITLDDTASLYMGRFSNNALKDFLTKDRPYELLCSRLRVHKQRTYAHLGLALLKPTSNAKQQELFSVEKHLQKFYRMIIRAQIDNGYDPISIPIPRSTLGAKLVMTDIQKMLEKNNLSCIFFFELGKEFPELLRHAVDDLEQSVIGFQYKRFDKAVQSYESIRGYHDRDVAFVVANTQRCDYKFGNLSTVHYMPFLSNDIFATMVPGPMVPNDLPNDPQERDKEIRSRRLQRLHRLQLFDKNRLTLNHLIQNRFDIDKLLTEIDQPNNFTLRAMLANFEEASTSDNDLKLQRLSAFTKIHESKASSAELNEFSKRIKGNDVKEYVDEDGKNTLKRAIVQLGGGR